MKKHMVFFMRKKFYSRNTKRFKAQQKLVFGQKSDLRLYLYFLNPKPTII